MSTHKSRTTFLTAASALAFTIATAGADTTVRIPAESFVGGNHSTYCRSGADVKRFGADWEQRAARKVALFSQGVQNSKTEAQFSLEAAPAGKSTLSLTGLDDIAPENTKIRIRLNGKLLYEGETSFANTEHIYVFNDWKTQTWPVPAGALVKGNNKLEIENLMDGHSDKLNWVAIHAAELKIEGAPVGWQLAPGEAFLGSEFLKGKVEPVIYPAALKNDTVHLVAGRFLMQGFSHMAGESLVGKKVRQIIDLPQTVTAQVLSGQVESSKVVQRNGVAYQRLTLNDTINTSDDRRIRNGGYPTLGLKTETAGEMAPLYVRFEVDGEAHPEKKFAVRSWRVDAAAALPKQFFLGLWGAGKPREEIMAADFGRLLQENGFGLVFGTTNADEARYFQQFGVKYYSRYGAVKPAMQGPPSITFEGKPDPSTFDPFYMIEHPDAVKHPTIQRGIEAALMPEIDGVCCDYELLVDTWSERALKEFRVFLPKYKDMTDEAIRQTCRDPKTGQYAPSEDWMNFRRMLNARVVGRIQREMDKVRPGMPYLSLASASDLPCYWWDGAERGRFRVQDLAREVREVAVSTYHYDHPGGLPSIPAIVKTSLQRAEGRPVGIHMIGIFSGTLIELYRYERLHLEAWQMRQDILLGATAGGRAFHFFRADQLDGEYLAVAGNAMHEVARLEPLLAGAEQADNQLKVSFVENPKYTIPVSGSTTIYDKLLWSGQLERQHTQMLRVRPDGTLTVLLFNFMNVPIRQTVAIDRDLKAPGYRVTSISGAKQNAAAVISAEQVRAGVEFSTGAQDVTIITLTPTEK